MKRDLPVISLFTGAGGLDLGLEAAGFRTAIAIEVNPTFQRTLRKNNPHWEVPENGDVTAVPTKEILRIAKLKRGEAALVVGGAPCQPFSNMGSKKGVEDDRGALFQEFIRIVREARPQAFIFENVQGMTSVKHSEVINSLKSELEREGYKITADVLNSADFGVPQKRKRLIILGALNMQPELPRATHARDGKDGLRRWMTVRQAFSTIAIDDFNRDDCYGMNHSEEMVSRIAYVKPGGNFRDVPNRLLPNCWKTGRHQGQDTFGRLKLDEPSVTIRTCGYNPTKGRYIHPTQNRGLNTIEMARIQGFPKDYRFEGGLKNVGEQIGNAVPPLLGEVIGRALIGSIWSLSPKAEESSQAVPEASSLSALWT